MEYFGITKDFRPDTSRFSIVKAGKVPKDIYFLISGVLLMCSVDSVTPYMQLHPGGIYGEVYVLFGIPATYSLIYENSPKIGGKVVPINNVETYKVDATEYLNIIKDFVGVYTILRTEAVKKRRIYRKLKRECLVQKRMKEGLDENDPEMRKISNASRKNSRLSNQVPKDYKDSGIVILNPEKSDDSIEKEDQNNSGMQVIKEDIKSQNEEKKEEKSVESKQNSQIEIKEESKYPERKSDTEKSEEKKDMPAELQLEDVKQQETVENVKVEVQVEESNAKEPEIKLPKKELISAKLFDKETRKKLGQNDIMKMEYIYDSEEEFEDKDVFQKVETIEAPNNLKEKLLELDVFFR